MQVVGDIFDKADKLRDDSPRFEDISSMPRLRGRHGVQRELEAVHIRGAPLVEC